MFNAGEKRRSTLGAGQNSNFFDTTNASSAATRDLIAMETLDELLAWVTTEGECLVPRDRTAPFLAQIL